MLTHHTILDMHVSDIEFSRLLFPTSLLFDTTAQHNQTQRRSNHYRGEENRMPIMREYLGWYQL